MLDSSKIGKIKPYTFARAEDINVLITDNEFPDKLLIDSADYEIYTFANNSYTYAIDQDGFVQLTFSGSSYGYEYNSENGFSLEFLPVDYEDGYYAMFVIEDIYGNTYTSSAFRLGE